MPTLAHGDWSTVVAVCDWAYAASSVSFNFICWEVNFYSVTSSDVVSFYSDLVITVECPIEFCSTLYYSSKSQKLNKLFGFESYLLFDRLIGWYRFSKLVNPSSFPRIKKVWRRKLAISHSITERCCSIMAGFIATAKLTHMKKVKNFDIFKLLLLSTLFSLAVL